MRVLIVEDEALVAWHTAIVVEEAGHTIFGTAGSSRKARALCTSDLPDVALIDLRLNDGFTGLELAKQLAEAGVLVWFVTANETACKTHVSYAIGCVSKPFKDQTLVDALAMTDRFRAGHPFPEKPRAGMILYPRSAEK